MRKSLNSGIVKFGIAVLALSLNLFAACEIGLGSAVDTEVPEIDFADTTVASGAVVRDSFAVFGTFDDDGSISSLAATLTNLETGYSVDKDGEIDMENKTWSVVFDPKEDKIPDATYELSIVIKDSVDHESKISRSIIIDNTAPLVVLTRPSTKKGAANFDSYGQSFTLEGKAADDNDVSLIEVAVYDNPNCTGSPLKTISLPNVPLTIESDVATYAANTVNDYSVIYGHVNTSGFVIRDGTDATRYCKVIVYDGAQRYPADGSAQTAADKKGNSVNYYYLNSDLAELFTAGYKITELYHILNGTYEGTSSRSIGTSSVVSMLKNTQKQTNIGQFKLNPENSPHFVVSSRNTMNYAAGETLEDHSMTNGNSFIEVEITPGLDGHIIKEETIGVYLLRCRLKTAAEAAATGPGIVYLNSAGNVADDVDGNRIWLIPVNQHTQTADITQSGSTYKFKTKTSISTTNFTALDIGQGYVIKVTGEDMQGNDIVSDGDFCFNLTTSGVNIDITTASVNPLWISTNSAAKTDNKNPSVILKYSSENQDTSNAIHPFQVWRGLSTSTLEQIDDDISTSMTTISGAQATTTDTTLVSGLGITSSNKPATVYYKIKGINSAETITPKPVSLQYDDNNPTVSIPAADLPGASAGEQDSLTLRGNASHADSGIQKVYVQIYDKVHTSETTPAAPAVGATAASNVLTATYSGGTWVLPVTPAQHDGGTNEDSAFVREGKKVIIVTVEDAVGLRATTQASAGEFIYDKSKPTGTINGTVPAISSSVLNISGTAADGWGVAKVEITQKKKNSSGAFVNPIKRTVWEEASNATTPSPSVTWSTANTTNLTLPFSSSTASYTQTQMDGDSHPADGEYEYTVTITDKAGKTNQTTISKQISFYSVIPVVTFTQPTGAFALTDSASTTPWQTTSNTINVSGTASVNSGATITGVYYKLLADTSSAPTSYTGTGWTLAGQSNWSISESISDGVEKHLYVVAVDNANKQSAVYHKVIKVDTTAPTTTANCYKIDSSTDLNAVSGTVYVKNGTSLTIYGNYEDGGSGVQALTFKLGNTTITPASILYSTSTLTASGTTVTSVPADSDYDDYSAANAKSYKTWKAVFNNFTSSSTGGTLTATGTNGAGLTTPVTVINIQVDTSAPEVTITSPATNTFIGNAALSITGTANDGTGSGLSSEAFAVYYTKSLSLGGTTPTSITAGSNPSSAWVSLGTATSGATWTKALTQGQIESLSVDDNNTDLWFTVAVKDKAGSGNIGYAVPVKVTVDRKLPVYDSTETRIGGKTLDELTTNPWFSTSTLVVSGEYSDNGSGVDKIIYQLGSGTAVELPTDDGTFNTNISGFTSGATGNVLKLKAKDKVGNITSESSYTVKVDTSTTTLSANCYKKGSAATLYPATGTAYLGNTTTAITIYGRYLNTVSGIEQLTFKYGDSALTPTSVQYSTGELTFNSSNVVTAVPADNTFGTYAAGSATSYKTWKAVFTPTANGRLTVEGSNKAGTPVSATAFEVTIDTENPSLENIKLKETTGTGASEVTKDAYIRESNSTYYVNNSSTAGKAFKVTGVATDNYGVEKVSFSVVRWANGAATSDTLTVTDIQNPSGAWEKAITDSDWSSWTDSAKITVTATDKAGRTISSTINVSFDTVAPKAMHWADAKNKDIYFRIGNADNDKNAAGTQWETGDAVGTANNPKNEDVGGKYSYGTWGSDSSIEIRGTFEEADTGSGIKAIYYAIFDNATTLEAKLSDFTAGTLAEDPDNHVIKVGSFAPLDTAVTKKVPYNKNAAGTLKANKEITTNFRTTLSGFNAQENFLVLLAEDYAGNRALDQLKVTEGTTTTGTGDNATVENNGTAITNGPNTWNSSKAYYGIKKDTQTPNIATSVTEGIYTNGAGNAITISGTASDLLSGLKNVLVTIEDEQVSYSQSYSGFVAGSTTQSWSVTIPANTFASINSGSYTVYAEATDKAGSGNKKKISAATIYVDKQGPTVTINSPAANAKVAGTYNISGTARDGTGAGVNTAATAKPVLYYTTNSSVGANAPTTSTIGTDASTSWKSYGNPTLSAENGQDWTLDDADFTSIAAANENTSVYIAVSAIDKSGSGNTGYSSPRLVTVDRHAPQKSAFNIGTTAESSINTTWFNNNTLNINGSFTDDGTTGSGVAAVCYKLDNGTEQEIPSTGSFDRPVAGFTDTTSATPHTLQVRAKDAVGNYSTWESYSVKVDTARPVISAVAGHPFTETTLTNGSAARTFYFDVLDTGSGITVPAANATAAQIANIVTVEISNSSNQLTTITHGSNGSTITVGAADATTGKHLVTVVIGAADLATLSGSNSVLVSVSDTAGNQSNLQSIGTLNVDIDDPVPAFTSHNHTATVNKQITLSGTVTDASNSAITAMSLTATCGSTTKVYGYPTGTDGNITYSNGQWSYTLDTTVFNNTTTAANMTLALTATDAAGNTGSATPPVPTDTTIPMTLSIDQNSDRPVIKFTNLVREGEGTNESPYKYILKYGNEAQLEGSISDDDSTASAVVTTFIASSSPITSATATLSGTTTFNAATGEFSFKPADTADGLKTVYFYVVDNKGNAFYTTQTTQLTRPYQQYKTAAKEDNAAAFNYSSDSNAPTINSVQLQAYTDTAANGGTASGSATTLGASCIVGGENKKFITLSVSAKDGNGIQGIVIELEQATGANTSVLKRYRSNTSVGTGTFTAEGSVDPTENINQNHVYTTDRLDLETLGFTQDADSSVNDIKDGKVTVRVYVYDNSGLYSNQESLFVIDNTAPSLNITTPAVDDVQVYALQSNTVGGSVDGHTDVDAIYYAVTTTGTAPTAEGSGTSDAGWHEIPNAKLSASVIFDGTGVGTSGTEGFHSETLRTWIKTLNNQSDAQLNANDNRITVYVHYKVVDKCGNAGITTRSVSAYPNGDKPVIELVYPEDKAGGLTPSLAGTIRVYGYASVYIGSVTATYIQIDPSFETTFSSNWEQELTAVCAGTEVNYVVEDIGSTGLRGIKANGTQNWNLPINTNNEFNPAANATESRHMAIRVYSLSDSGKVSEPFLQKFDVDPNAPHIGGDGTKDNLTDTTARQYSLQVVEFANVTAGQDIDITTNQNPVAYKTDMWIKGQKYLIASVYDDSGIKSLTLNENINGVQKINLVSFIGTGENQNVTINHNASLNTLNGGGHITVEESVCGYGTGTRNINIVIPLPATAINWQLEATEDSGNNNSCTETIKINYDDAAPRLGMTDHAKYSIDADIHQSNGFYTLKGYATDAEGDNSVSGMRGVAFYFMRRGTADTDPVTKVYDPMLQNNSVAVRTGLANATGIIYSHGLYWKTKTVTRDTTNLKKLTLSAADSNIHAGGLALLGGNIYRIESVSGVNVMLEEEVPVTQTTANFALALVVDNLNKKETTTGRSVITAAGYGHGYYSALASADDGDLMQEDWDGTSIEGQWTAIINSANIPDGPIELHYVAFDKAQNYAVGIVGNVAKATYEGYATLDASANAAITGATTDTTNKLQSKYYYVYDTNKPAYISNNAPRIAGVTVGTDYNGDGTIAASEKRSKYSGEANRFIGGEATDNIVRKPTSVTKNFNASSDGTDSGAVMMTIRDKMEIELEIIGGNGDLFYQYKRDNGAYTQGSAMVAVTTTPLQANQYHRNSDEGETTDYVGQAYYKTTVLPKLEFTEAQLKEWYTTNNDKSWWTVEIWDSTEETIPFTNSQTATLRLPLNIQVNDTTDPNTVISPLYWKSKDDNSVYRDVNGNRLGHVELKGELETGTGKLGNASVYGSDDDKISGIVVFKGFAYDNKRLANLKWAVIDHVANNTYTTPTYLFPATGSSLQNGATFTNGTWSSTATLASNHYTFEVSTAADDGAYLDEKGHKVAWTLTVDTSYIKNVVEKDARIYVYAQDTAGRTTTITNTAVTSTSTDQATYDLQTKIPTYQVDILPYITKVKTKLAKKNKKNPEVYSRTAQGHYPIASSETTSGSVVLEGFNLTAGNGTVDISSAIGSRTTGAYEYTVTGTISTINNINNNDAHGSYNINAANLSEETKVLNMYNRTPSTITNLTLNDDVYFDMWEFKKAAAPKSGKINEPVMRINPTNDMIGFAFANGADALSLPNSSSNSYTAWQKNYADYSGINFVYDTNGYVHSVSTGLDTEPNQGYGGYMQYIFSRWGGNGVNNMYNWNADTTSALESVAVPSQTYIGNTQLTANLIDIDRFGTPAIAVATRTNPTVYIAYYDGDSNHIRFRYGSVSNTKSGRVNNLGQLSDDKCASGTVIGHNNRGAEETHAAAIGDDDTTGATTYAQHRGFEAHTDYYSILAGKSNGATQTDTGNGASEFVALDVIPGANANADVVVIVWYDGSDLMYTYREGEKDDKDCNSDGVTGKWSKPEVIFEGAGQYCTIKVDKNNGIHIAAYNRSGADLYYCYMSGYDKYASRKTALVDSYSQVGKYISLDTALVLREGSTTEYNVVPYITYYGDGFNGLPKLAYLPGGINSASPIVPNGADDDTDLFTGKWEVSIIPTSSEVNEDNMNVALWKTNAGVLTASTKPATGYTEPTITAAGTNSATWYGNGSSELVLGYGITDGATGFIEIAQRK